MIEIDERGKFNLKVPPRAINRLRRRFSKTHHLVLKGFLRPALLRKIQRQLTKDRAKFCERTHQGIGMEFCLEPNAVTARLLWFLVNDPELFRFIQKITGCHPIGVFAGRVYQLRPAEDHSYSWHSDDRYHRMLTMSINLGEKPYQGGTLQIRDRKSKKVLCTVENKDAGDALLFRISPSLEHCVSHVRGAQPKVAYAGWFFSEPDFRSILQPDAATVSSNPP